MLLAHTVGLQMVVAVGADGGAVAAGQYVDYCAGGSAALRANRGAQQLLGLNGAVAAHGGMEAHVAVVAVVRR